MNSIFTEISRSTPVAEAFKSELSFYCCLPKMVLGTPLHGHAQIMFILNYYLSNILGCILHFCADIWISLEDRKSSFF